MRFGRKKLWATTWYNCDIPARLFFTILESDRLHLLVMDIPKNERLSIPPKPILNQTWTNIYDEFFELKNDRKLRLIIETKKTILQLERTIEIVKPVLYALARTPFNEKQLKEIITALEPHGVKIDLSKPLTKQVLEALVTQLGGIRTRKKIEEDNLKNLTAGEKLSFEQNCVKFEEFDFTISENVSLRKYVAYEKAVIRKAKTIKNRNHGRRTVN